MPEFFKRFLASQKDTLPVNHYEGFNDNGAVVLRDRRGTRKAEIPNVDLKSETLGDERSLRRALSEYVEHFHAERNHCSRLGPFASSCASVGISTMLQCLGSPRSQPKTARLSSCVSSRSDFARRGSRDTATLVGWMT